MASSSKRTPQCAACKFLKLICLPECAHAPLFPADQPAKVASLHRVFGFSHVMKLLSDLHPCQRQDAANTLAYQAEMRLRDPVYGCVGVISFLQQHLRQLEMELNGAKAELSNMMGNDGGAIEQHDFLNDNNQEGNNIDREAEVDETLFLRL